MWIILHKDWECGHVMKTNFCEDNTVCMGVYVHGVCLLAGVESICRAGMWSLCVFHPFFPMSELIAGGWKLSPIVTLTLQNTTKLGHFCCSVELNMSN